MNANGVFMAIFAAVIAIAALYALGIFQYSPNLSPGDETPIAEENTNTATLTSTSNNPDSCTDSDYGKFIFITGSVIGYKNNEKFNLKDSCINDETVQEVFCQEIDALSQDMSCGQDGTGERYCIGNSVYHNKINYFCSDVILGPIHFSRSLFLYPHNPLLKAE